MLDLVFAARHGGQSEDAPRLVNTWSDDAGRVFARGLRGQSTSRIEWPGLGAFVFSSNSPVVVLESLPNVDRHTASDIFTRIVQPIILQAQGHETLHASAVAGPSGAIAFCGVSGSGKSTFAWALGRRAPFDQIADDALVLSGFDDTSGGEIVRVRPLSYRPRLRDSAVAFFGQAQTSPDAVPDAVPLQAIVLLRQDAAAPSERPRQLPAAAAFSATLTHAYCFDEADRTEAGRMVRHYLTLAASVPVFELRYQPSFERLDAVLDTVLAALAASRPVAS